MKRFGLLGEHLSHSFSVPIHRALGGYPYELYEVPPEEVEAFVRRGDPAGFNVTIPYKERVLPLMDELTDRARAVGSVNTVLRRPDGSLLGDNTDVFGMAYMLRGFDLSGAKVLILGSGGSRRTAEWVLPALGAAYVTVISRSGEDNYTDLDRHADADFILNTTPVGMFPNNGEAPLSLDGFPRLRGVADLIYNPARTRLLLDAEARGIPTAGGLPMLVEQARRAAELFGGEPIPAERTGEIADRMRRDAENMVLIGMPGCGKTTVGRALAALARRPFYDCDEEIAREAGLSVPDLIAREGENAFRRRETEALSRLTRLSGAVIATGGGCVTRRENRDLLRQNGRVYYLSRPLRELTAEGRPISQREGIVPLFSAREPLYRAWSDASVPVTHPEATAREILRIHQENIL